MVIGLPSIHSPLLPHNEASSTSHHDHNVPGRDMIKSLSRVLIERALTSERQTVSLGVLGTLVLVDAGRAPAAVPARTRPSMSVVYPCLDAILSSSMRVPGAEGRSLPAGWATLEAWVRAGLPGVNSHVVKSSSRS